MRKIMTYLLACSSMMMSISVFADSPHTFSANVALSTDYVYRGQSQTGNLPSISGGLDYSHESGLYAGAWASNIDGSGQVFTTSTMELDIYGGYGGELGGTGISYDAGLLYYIYPGQADGADYNFLEGYLGFSYDFTDKLSAGVTFRATPDWQGATGEGFNVEGTVDYALPYDFTLSGMVGHQAVDENTTWGTPDWTYYSVGLSRTLIGPFDASVTYVDTDLSNSECFGGGNVCDGRAVFTISSSW